MWQKYFNKKFSKFLLTKIENAENLNENRIGFF
jgi:hypothetical protein